MTRRFGMWTLIAALSPLLSCESRTLEVPSGQVVSGDEKHYPQVADKDIDILFVIDNSGSMEAGQKNLAA